MHLALDSISFHDLLLRCFCTASSPAFHEHLHLRFMSFIFIFVSCLKRLLEKNRSAIAVGQVLIPAVL